MFGLFLAVLDITFSVIRIPLFFLMSMNLFDRSFNVFTLFIALWLWVKLVEFVGVSTRFISTFECVLKHFKFDFTCGIISFCSWVFSLGTLIASFLTYFFRKLGGYYSSVEVSLERSFTSFSYRSFRVWFSSSCDESTFGVSGTDDGRGYTYLNLGKLICLF